MLAQIADLRLCALMSEPLCPAHFCLRPYVVDRVEMHVGLFKQNCNRSWITAATLVAGIDTWKRVTSLASQFRRLI